MIDQAPAPHKPALHLVLAIALLLGGLLGLAGCGSSPSDDASSRNPAASSSCDVGVLTAPWDLFVGFCEATEAGTPPSREQLQAFAELPSLVAWCQGMDNPPRAFHVTNWLEFFFTPDQVIKKNTHTRDRAVFSRSYRFSMDHRPLIQSHLEAFLAEDLACEVQKEANFWLRAEQQVKDLDIVFLPSKPELRCDGDRLFVDTGVLGAGSNAQLVRQLAGLLFRTHGFTAGPIPTGLEGEEAVAHSVRTMMDEGIRGFIEDLPHTRFHKDHPKLGDVNIIPENVYMNGREAVGLFNRYIPLSGEDEQAIATMGTNLAMTLLASASLNQGGYCMAACIGKNLGRDRLRETVGNPAAFLKAYQEAARQNPSPAPDPYTVPDALTTSMPPLDEAVFTELLRICDTILTPAP